MDPIAFVVVTMAPGIVVVATAIVLVLRAKPGPPSVLAGRIWYLGWALIMLLPGFGIALSVARGVLMRPALIGAAVPLLIGGGILYGLRLNWDQPWRGNLAGDSRDIPRR
jgi:hypothetical protein